MEMVNISELTCRVCLKEQNIMINIYDELEELQTNLSNLLEICGDLHIDENDIFPKFLCEECTRELLICSNFREKCCKSKEILSEIEQQNATDVEIKEADNLNELIEYSMDDLNNIIEDTEVNIEEENNLINEETQDYAAEEMWDVPPVDSQTTTITNEIEVTMDSNEISYDIDDVNKDFLPDIVLKDPPINLIDSPPPHSSLAPTDLNVNIEPDYFKTIDDKISNDLIFNCDICGATFKHAINLQKHLQKSHAPLRLFACEKCEHWFSIETEFYKHTQSCNYFKTADDDLEDNKRKKSPKIIAKTIDPDNRKCIYCEREFPTPFALRMHLRTHTGERPYQCKYCIKSFKTQSALNAHNKRHTGQADYVCNVCNKSFFEQGNLTVHMRSHTGERPHVCTVCNKTFTRVFLLQLHMRTHTGEKPYNCSYCDKSFRQSTDLRSHLTIHTGHKQYSCPLCSKAYIKRNHLMQHMSKHSVLATDGETLEAIQYKQSLVEITDASVNISAQDPEIVYSFDDIIESEDVVLQSEDIS